MPVVKYGVVLIIGVVFVGFLDENSIYAHLCNRERISELNDEIAFYESEYQRDQKRIHELQTNPKAMEKIARERYFMKAQDEDIFVLSDDEQPEKQKRLNHETVE
ncbi:MAG: septum formation initiator family protein [Prevotella sp.]|nr:septum formation initiator family protein [Prevotella sp.]